MSAALGIELVLCLSKTANLRGKERFRMHSLEELRGREPVLQAVCQSAFTSYASAVDKDCEVKQEGDDGHGRDQGEGDPPAF
jgi:hypothetical protein